MATYKIDGDLDVTGTIRTSEYTAASEYWLSLPRDTTIIKLDNSVGDLGELQFGIPGGDYSPAFYGSLGVDMWDGRTKEYPAVKFNYYDENSEYESTTEERIATQEWSDARYLKLTGGTITNIGDTPLSLTYDSGQAFFLEVTDKASNHRMSFDNAGLSTDQSYSLPDKSGTIALTDDVGTKLYMHRMTDGNSNAFCCISLSSTPCTEAGTDLLTRLDQDKAFAIGLVSGGLPADKFIIGLAYQGTGSLKAYLMNGSTTSFNSENYTDTVTEL